MKKIIFIAMLLCLCFSVFAKPKAKKQKSLYEHGLELISLMNEKVQNENYCNFFFSGYDDSIEKIISETALGNVSKPSAVYNLHGDFSAFESFMMSWIGQMDTGTLSPRLKEELDKKLFGSIPMIWSSKMGSTYEIAAASILQTQTAFSSTELKENCIYIYTFDDSFPITVSFLHGEDDVVIAIAYYVFDKDFPKSIEDFLSEIGSGLKIEKIK